MLKSKITSIISIFFVFVLLSVNLEAQKQEGKEEITIEQSDGKIVYEDEGRSLNTTLSLNLASTFVNVDDNLWTVRIGNRIKFGWNNTYTIALSATNETFSARYIIDSDEELTIQGTRVITSPRVTQTTCGSIQCTNTRREIIDFSDICRATVDKETIIFNPACSFTELKDNQIQLDFLTIYDSMSDTIIIDPTIIIEDVSLAVSTLTNVTVENNFSHLAFGNNNIDFINETNLAAYFPFDVNASAITAYDWSVRNNDGDWTGNAHWNDSGIIGGAYEGDGSGDYILLEDDLLDLNLTANYTIMGWVKPDTSSGGIVKRGAGSSSNFNTQVFSILWSSSEIIRYGLGTGAANQVVDTNAGTAPDGVWVHFACGLNASTHMHCYLNGVLQNNIEAMTLGPLWSAATRVSFIGASRAQDLHWNGLMDEIMFINTSLSAEQVLAVYRNQSSRFHPRGEQIFNNVSLDGTGGDNRINITVNITENFDSILNVSIGDKSGDDYSYADELGFTNNRVTDATVGTSDNFSLKFIFYAGNKSSNSFISPTLENDIQIDSYTAAAADTCTYTSGDWVVDCSDDCSITSDVTIDGGSDVTIIGTGTFTVDNAIVSGFSELFIHGTDATNICEVFIMNGASIG